MVDSKDLYLVIMAGGSGTRFWPKSTSRKPKQLLSFGGEGTATLLEQTLSRFDGWIPPSNRMIVTTELLKRSVQEVSSGATVLAEPQARNTAPCVYWAAQEVSRKNPNAVMLVMPADHFMARPDAFISTVKEAAKWAREHDDLVTLGVRPTRPETGYGYLRLGPSVVGSCKKVAAFVEKPNLAKAQEFVSAGNYLWNGGMFIWKTSTILHAFDQSMPEMKKAWDQAHGKVQDAYPNMTATSIDFGVMEKASNVVTYTLDCGWDDLGNWISLESLADQLQTRQEAGVVTSGHVVNVDSRSNIIDVPGKLVALLGIEDLIVVEQGQALMIARKDRSQDIRLIVDLVKKQRPELA